jgi:hypothetical protein
VQLKFNKDLITISIDFNVRALSHIIEHLTQYFEKLVLQKGKSQADILLEPETAPKSRMWEM